VVALFTLVASILSSAMLLRAQSTPPADATTVASGPAAADVMALADAVRDLRAQVQALSSELTAVREEQELAHAESREIRRELDLARRGQTPLAIRAAAVASFAPAIESPVVASVPSSSATPQERVPADPVSQIEENQELMDAKLNEQAQTKVESGSKYRVRLSGIVLMNLFSNRGTVDNLDYPEVALASGSFDSPGTFGGSLRQSQIGVEVFGPNIAGAHTSANVRFDFAGGLPDTPNGAVMGLVRLRTGTVQFDWRNTSLIGGQDALFFAPLAPRSLASVAVPALSYAGNLWSWAPQVRVEHRVTLSEASSLLVQVGILDSLSGDLPYSSFIRYPSWGEESGQPAYAARIAWSHSLFGQMATLGAGGYYGRQFWGFNQYVDGWASTADLTLPLGRLFQLTGQFYRGRAVGGLGGAIGQTVLMSGPFGSPSTEVKGIDSMGGWVQLKFKPTAKLEFNGAVGQDNPFAHQLREYSANSTSYYGPLLSKNLSPFVNVIYTVRSNVLFSFEYRYLRTFPLDSAAVTAHQINLVS
jgi:outer membrane murein-binding lipoprotein Lpp